MNEEISWTTNKGKGKTTINEWDNDHSDILQALYCV